jgi:hypothetical protein
VLARGRPRSLLLTSARPSVFAAPRRSASVVCSSPPLGHGGPYSPALGPGASWAAGHDRRSLQAEEGAPHVLSEHAASAAVSRNRRGVMTSECPRRLPVIDQAWSRPRDTRSKRRLADVTVASARRCRGGSRAGAWTRCIPAATRHPCAHVDVADHSKRRSPRRLRDTTDRSACADRMCGAPSSAVQRSSIVVSGWGYTVAGRRRAATEADRGGAPASSIKRSAAPVVNAGSAAQGMLAQPRRPSTSAALARRMGRPSTGLQGDWRMPSSGNTTASTVWRPATNRSAG